jgi:hypothetical protein
VATDILAADHPIAVPSVRRKSRRLLAFSWLAWLAVMTLLGVVTVNVVRSEGRANADSEQAHEVFDSTQREIRLAASRLTATRGALEITDRQVAADSSALARDVEELNAVRNALADAQAHVFQQTRSIDSLHLCLGGVEKALNALSVNDQADAIAALEAVSSSCDEAAGPGD